MTDRPQAWAAHPDLLDRVCREAGEVLIRTLYAHRLPGRVELQKADDGRAVSLRLELTPEQATLLAQVLEQCRKRERKGWWRRLWWRSSKQ